MNHRITTTELFLPKKKMTEMGTQNNNEVSPFSEYMWMGDMDKFDLELESKLEEEEFIRSCVEQLLEEEEERETMFFARGGQIVDMKSNIVNGIAHHHNGAYAHSNPRQNVYMNGFASDSVYPPSMKLKGALEAVTLEDLESQTSSLNPYAAPFVLNPHAKEFIPKTPAPGQNETVLVQRPSSSTSIKLSSASSS